MELHFINPNTPPPPRKAQATPDKSISRLPGRGLLIPDPRILLPPPKTTTHHPSHKPPPEIFSLPLLQFLSNPLPLPPMQGMLQITSLSWGHFHYIGRRDTTAA